MAMRQLFLMENVFLATKAVFSFHFKNTLFRYAFYSMKILERI